MSEAGVTKGGVPEAGVSKGGVSKGGVSEAGVSRADTASADTYRALLGAPTFRVLWLGESAGRLAFQVTSFLLPLLAVVTLARSGLAVGLLSAAQFVPVVGLALVAGALVGRVPLRAVLVTANAVRAAALASLGAAGFSGGLTFGHLLLVAALVGTATVFYDVSFQAAVPHLLPVGSIAPANGLLQATYSMTQLAGPAAAGLLLERLGVAASTTVAAVCFLAAAGTFILLRPPAAAGRAARSARRSVGEGLRYVWRCRPIRDLCLQAGTFNFFEQAFVTAFLVHAVRGLHLSGTTVGLVLGAGSVGAVVGSLLAPRIRRVRVGLLVCTALPVAAGGFLLTPASAAVFGGRSAPLMVAFAINGVALAVFNVYAVSLRQAIPPEEMLGSVTASYRLVAFGAIPLGALVGGAAVDLIGGSAALWLIAGAMVAVLLPFLGSPLRALPTVAEARAFGAATPVDAPARRPEKPIRVKDSDHG